MMSDALTAANIITHAMVANDIADTFTTARARRGYEGEIAHLQAWLDWMERRHQVMVGVCEQLLETAKSEQAKDRARIAELERQVDGLERNNAELEAARKTAEAERLTCSIKLSYLRTYGVEHPDLVLNNQEVVG